MQVTRSLYETVDDLSQRHGARPMFEAPCYVKPRKLGKDEDRTMEFVLSTAGIKRDGWEIKQTGWDLTDFRKNPRVLWCHDDYDFPIATSLREWISSSPGVSKHLRGVARFVTADKNPKGEQAWLMYRDGDLDATSVRWLGLEIEKIEDEEYKAIGMAPPYWGGVRFVRSKLTEWSGVPLPCDQNCLAVRSQSMPAELRDMLVLPRTPVEIEGVPLLRLDGHWINHEVDRKVFIDLAVTNTEDTEPTRSEPAAKEDIKEPEGVKMNIKLAEWAERASKQRPEKWVSMAAQRLMQGVLNVDGVTDGELRGFLAEKLSCTPWSTQVGKQYEETHRTLRSVSDPTAVDMFRSSAVVASRLLFGDDRSPELWECFYNKETEAVKNLIETGFRKAVGELIDCPEDMRSRLDVMIDSILTEFSATGRLAQEYVSARSALNVPSDVSLVDYVKSLGEQKPGDKITSEETVSEDTIESLKRTLEAIHGVTGGPKESAIESKARSIKEKMDSLFRQKDTPSNSDKK